jgi:uncharacterized phiE125 gp8 family phage protein
MPTTQTIAPATDPITLADVKQHMRVDGRQEDGYINGLIAAATSYIQNETGRQFVTATFETKFDGFADTLILPRSPLVSVTSIQYIDEDGDTQTLDSSYYTVDTASQPGRVNRAYDTTYPNTQDVSNALTVTYTAGYGTASEVPSPIRAAINLLVAHWFENREPVAFSSPSNIPFTITAIMNQYKLREVY